MFKISMKTTSRQDTSSKFPVECPKCKKTTEHAASKLKRGGKIVCPRCGAQIGITNDGLETAAKSLANLLKKR